MIEYCNILKKAWWLEENSKGPELVDKHYGQLQILSGVDKITSLPGMWVIYEKKDLLLKVTMVETQLFNYDDCRNELKIITLSVLVSKGVSKTIHRTLSKHLGVVSEPRYVK